MLQDELLEDRSAVRLCSVVEYRCLTVSFAQHSVTIRPTEFGIDFIQYRFHRVFGPEADTEAVYDHVRPVLRHAVAGVHAAIIAFGPSGAGKSHTMLGACTTFDSVIEGISVSSSNLNNHHPWAQSHFTAPPESGDGYHPPQSSAYSSRSSTPQPEKPRRLAASATQIFPGTSSRRRSLDDSNRPPAQVKHFSPTASPQAAGSPVRTTATEPGIVPRVIADLFASRHKYKLTCWMAVFDVLDTNIADRLPPRKLLRRFQIQGDDIRQTTITRSANVSEVLLRNRKTTLKLLKYIIVQRYKAIARDETGREAHSHFVVRLHLIDRERGVQSKLHMVDLASADVVRCILLVIVAFIGCSHASQGQTAADPASETFAACVSANSDLLYLGQMIRARAYDEAYVPYNNCEVRTYDDCIRAP